MIYIHHLSLHFLIIKLEHMKLIIKFLLNIKWVCKYVKNYLK